MNIFTYILVNTLLCFSLCIEMDKPGLIIHTNSLFTLNQDATYRILEYLPLNNEVHNYRLICKSCHNISIKQDQQIYDHVHQIWRQLHHIHQNPNNSTMAIQEITKLYNSLKLHPKFAAYLPSIIKQVIHINNSQLLYLFNIKFSMNQTKFSKLNPINKLLLQSSRELLHFIEGYINLPIVGPKQIYKIIFDFTFDYLSNTRNNQTLQMDQLIELGLILWDPFTKTNVNDLNVRQFMSMINTFVYDDLLETITDNDHSIQRYQSFLNQLDLHFLLKWIKIADLDESQQFKQAISGMKMHQYSITERVIDYLYDIGQYQVIRYLFKKLYIIHPIIPPMRILNFDFHRFIRKILIEILSSPMLYNDRSIGLISNEICAPITTFLHNGILRYYRYNETETDLHRIKQGVMDLCEYLAKDNNDIYIRKDEKMKISALIINLAFIDFEKGEHLKTDNIALLKLLEYTENIMIVLQTKKMSTEYEKFQQHIISNLPTYML